MSSMASESKKSKKSEKQEKVQCGICWNDCNKSNRKVVDCPYCHLQACRECVKYYLTSKTDLAHCMGCNKPWDRKFLQESLTKSYFNGKISRNETLLMSSKKILLCPRKLDKLNIAPIENHLPIDERL